MAGEVDPLAATACVGGLDTEAEGAELRHGCEP